MDKKLPMTKKTEQPNSFVNDSTGHPRTPFGDDSQQRTAIMDTNFDGPRPEKLSRFLVIIIKKRTPL